MKREMMTMMMPKLHRQDVEKKAAHSTVAAELQVRREGENGVGGGGVRRMKAEMMTPKLHHQDFEEKAAHSTVAPYSYR